MSNPSAVATRADIDDILRVILTFMEQVDTRFNTLETKSDGLDQRLFKLEQKVDQLTMDSELTRLDVARVYTQLENINMELETVEHDHLLFDHCLENVEKAVQFLAQKSGYRLPAQ